MKNLKVFIAFSKKEFYHITRDVRTMMILLLMPIAQILLFGFALNTDISGINFAVLDFSKDTKSTKIVQSFASNPYFTFTRKIYSQAELQRIFNDNAIDMVLVFNNNFVKDSKMQLILDASDPNRASMINMYASNVLNSVNFQISHINLKPPITPSITMLFNPQGKSAYSFVPGLIGMILMLICAMMTSISIVREKEQGSMEVLLVSPIKPFVMIVAKIVPYFVISCVSLTIVLFISVYALELKIAGSMFWLLCFCMLYIALTLSIGLLVSTIAKTQLVAMLVSGMVFMMPIMMLSGMMFPRESMPLILQGFSYIIPTSWFISGIKKIMIEGLPISYAIVELSVLAGMFALILAISLKKFKIRLE
ncbi:multidrug ABC transporter permease [Helicobacter didelphidarum]|uniref:Transport permease protein n=1 Tax=Helicobacter didelphidarum TaxID=2040648 RepID=A0A3D8ILT2_9HELI|nr:ABC transporter permease [Helicobacter didelphidarum]RDU65970.1 multidrug ABC transporter permease [Helicobacter didelphidarum]